MLVATMFLLSLQTWKIATALPFPFCGNRFEFRAVGSTQNIAFPLAIVNTAYAESMAELSDRGLEGGESVRDGSS